MLNFPNDLLPSQHDGYKILCWRREGTSIADSESTEVPPPPHHVIDNYTRSTLPTE